VIDAVQRALLSPDEVRALQDAAVSIQAWPAGSHVWGHYAEQTENGPAICRTENVSACDPTVEGLVEDVLAAAAQDVLGEPATAFKDKMNYKQPGGAGFSPHQDVVAYPGVSRVLSILVAVDECTLESGCLWLADGVDLELATDDRGAVRADVAAALTFRPAELSAGDAVCIDGFAPHYSEANRSPHARRVLVASYAPASESYSRAQYYAARRSTMADASARDGRFRISTLADFEGDEVTPDVVAADVCTHAAARSRGWPSTRHSTP
jgi:2-aminoethylphosphonate dioxygenase